LIGAVPKFVLGDRAVSVAIDLLKDTVQLLLVVVLDAEVGEIGLERCLDLGLGVEVSEVLEGLGDLFLVLLFLLL